MDAYILNRTPNPAQLAETARGLAGVRTARVLVGGSYDVLVALTTGTVQQVESVRQSLYDSGATGASTLVVVPLTDAAPPPMDPPWTTPDGPVNLVCGLTVSPGAVADAYFAVAVTPGVTGAAVVVGEYDILLKVSVATEPDAAPVLLAVAGVSGVLSITSAYVLPA